jgi:hypothetical protein
MESSSKMSVWQRAVSNWRCGSSGGSGHALAQAIDLRELGDVVVGGDIDGQVKLLVVVDLATSSQAIFLSIYFGLAGKVLAVKRNGRL